MLVFGTKKLRNIGEDLGSAVKGFKQGMKDGSEAGAPPAQVSSLQNSQTIDAEAREEASPDPLSSFVTRALTRRPSSFLEFPRCLTSVLQNWV